MTDKSILQMRDRQRRVFRIACDPLRCGLTLKLIAADAGLHYDSVRDYAAGKTTMPITALFALVDVIPDDLLSLLLPDNRLIGRIPEDGDHAGHADRCVTYLHTYTSARDPESEMGVEIGPNEDRQLRAKRAA